MKTVTSVIVNKYTTKGVQPLNGNMMFMDFPFKRPTLYNFKLAEGCDVQVSQETYHRYGIGDSYTAECLELSEQLLLVGVLVATVVIVIVQLAALG